MIGTIINNRYTVTRLIGQGATSMVYAAEDRDRAGAIVAIKALRKGKTSDAVEDIIRLKNEVSALQRLDDPAIMRVHEVVETGQGVFLVTEYLEGASLQTLLSASPGGIDPDAAVEIVRQIAIGLCRVHAAGIIHRDIKPGNIMLLTAQPAGSPSADSISLKIIDFGLARIKDVTRFPELAPADERADLIAGTFAYMPPETFTGPGGAPDARSDLYSLGVLWYQTLAGVLPFTGDDVHAIINQHIARVPEPVSRMRPGLTPIIETMLMRLLAKDPADRYRSAQGLVNDIERYRAGERDFVPGMRDGEVRIQQEIGLIGRESELGELQALYARARAGRGSICLVGGGAGIGKTRLVHELQLIAYNDRVPFVGGGCAGGDAKTPFGPLCEALGHYAKKICRHPAARRNAVIGAMRAALGDLGGIVTGLVPALAEFLGDCPPAVPLDGDRGNNRFAATVTSFLLEVSAAENGLVLVLEDLHWSDEGTLSLLEAIIHDISKYPLLIVGTWREGEVPAGHGLLRLIRRAMEGRYPLKRVSLAPFDREQLRHFIAGTLREGGDGAVIDRIAGLVMEKGRGNPLFSREIIRHLAASGALAHDERRFVFDERPPDSLPVPPRIIDMLLEKISLLDDDERKLLSFAAVMGRRFELGFCIAVFGSLMPNDPADDLVAVIDRAIASHFLEEDREEKGVLAFVHDTVRDAFYAAVEPELRCRFHRAIGYALEKRHAPADGSGVPAPPELFRCARHFIEGQDHERSLRYAVPAGLAAAAQYAYEDAIVYLSAALMLGEQTGAPAQQQIWITRTIGEIYLTIGRYTEAMDLFRSLMPLIRDPLAKAAIYRHISTACFDRGDFEACEAMARQGLALIGEPLPGGGLPLLLSLGRELLIHLARRPLPAPRAKSLPAHRMEKYRLIMDYFTTLTWCYGMTDHRSFARTVLRALNVAERHIGRSAELGSAYSGYAVLCMTAPLMFRRSVRYHERALALKNEFSDTWGVAQCIQTMGYSYYFHGDYAGAVRLFDESIEIFGRIGDVKGRSISFAGQIITLHVMADFARTRAVADRYYEIAQRTRDNFGICLCLFYIGEIFLESGDFESADAYFVRALESSAEHKIWNIHCSVVVQRGMLAMEKGDFRESVERFQQAVDLERNRYLIRDLFISVYVFQVKAMLADYRHRTDQAAGERRRYLKKIRRLSGSAYRKNHPYVTQRGVAMAMRAEYYACAGNIAKAHAWYRKSLAHFDRYPVRYHQARTLLEYGEFLRLQGLREEARDYIEQAYRLFHAMGSVRYAQRAAELLGIDTQAMRPSLRQLAQRLKIDKKFQALVDLTRDINTNPDSDLIFQKALALIIDITGAERGCIMLAAGARNDDRRIAAAIQVNNTEGFALSRTIIDQVLRTGEAVLSATAEDDRALSAIESVAVFGLKSVLCVPLRYKNAVFGACYMDNKLSAAVFSEEDRDMAGIILDQISVLFGINPPSGGDEPQGMLDRFCEHFGITGREREIIGLILMGQGNSEIGRSLSISPYTVNNHIQKIFAKTGVNAKLKLYELIKNFDGGMR